jgi:hypothetical protein
MMVAANTRADRLKATGTALQSAKSAKNAEVSAAKKSGSAKGTLDALEAEVAAIEAKRVQAVEAENSARRPTWVGPFEKKRNDLMLQVVQVAIDKLAGTTDGETQPAPVLVSV